MRLLLKVLVGALAVLGLVFIGMTLYVNMVAGPCIYQPGVPVATMNGRYSATFEQTTCSDSAKSRADVRMSRLGSSEVLILLEITGTNDVTLTWASDSELVVSLPRSASVKQVSFADDWPRVTLKFKEQVDDVA